MKTEFILYLELQIKSNQIAAFSKAEFDENDITNLERNVRQKIW